MKICCATGVRLNILSLLLTNMFANLLRFIPRLRSSCTCRCYKVWEYITSSRTIWFEVKCHVSGHRPELENTNRVSATQHITHGRRWMCPPGIIVVTFDRKLLSLTSKLMKFGDIMNGLWLNSKVTPSRVAASGESQFKCFYIINPAVPTIKAIFIQQQNCIDI